MNLGLRMMWRGSSLRLRCKDIDAHCSTLYMRIYSDRQSSLHLRKLDEGRSRAASLVNTCWYALTEALIFSVNAYQHGFTVMRCDSSLRPISSFSSSPNLVPPVLPCPNKRCRGRASLNRWSFLYMECLCSSGKIATIS